MNRVSVLAIFSVFMTVQGAQSQESEKITVGTFTDAEMSQWQHRSFVKNTDYQLQDNVLVASCTDQASVIYREISVDLTETPILHWSWRVDGVHPELDDTIKAGDDYAVRLYVVNSQGSIFPWRAKAVNYVWSNSQPQGATWPSAYTDNDIMIATQSGQPEDSSIWVEEVRNVREDFKKHFGENITTIDSVAIMTDCDNSKLPSKGYYRDIWFSAQ